MLSRNDPMFSVLFRETPSRGGTREVRGSAADYGHCILILSEVDIRSLARGCHIWTKNLGAWEGSDWLLIHLIRGTLYDTQSPFWRLPLVFFIAVHNNGPGSLTDHWHGMLTTSPAFAGFSIINVVGHPDALWSAPASTIRGGCLR